MQYDYKSTADWEATGENAHVVELDVDLRLENVLMSGDPEHELATNEAGVRREIFTLIAGRMVPELAENADVDAALPDGKTSTKSHIHTDNSYSVTTNGPVSMENTIHVKMDVNSDRSLNGAQALYAERSGVAIAIANNVMHSLKATFFGVTKSTNRDSSKMRGNKTVELDALPMSA